MEDELVFVTAKACHTGGCVGIGMVPAALMVDTKVENGPALSFSRQEWVEFLAAIKAGRFTIEDLLAARVGRVDETEKLKGLGEFAHPN